MSLWTCDYVILFIQFIDVRFSFLNDSYTVVEGDLVEMAVVLEISETTNRADLVAQEILPAFVTVASFDGTACKKFIVCT